MFTKIKELWKTHGFEIILVVCIAFILIFALFRIGKKGTYSSTYKYVPAEKPKGNGPPKESKGEAECRRVLQDLFKKPFPSKRPDFPKESCHW